ncbi:MAG: molecular chaperone HtpG, partial [Sphingomonadales bacterium]
KSDITPEQYTEFYHHVAHAFDEPWTVLHYRAEGVLEYTVLLYIPTQQPFDLFDPARKPRVKLFVKRVFITDDCEDVLPGYLRFARGIIDSEDLPLNISREMLQNNPVLGRIRKAVTNKVLAELEKKAEDAQDYATFWESFGAVLKEGLYEDGERRDKILKLSRFRSTAGEDITSLVDYIARMKPDQQAIYYITGDSIEAARRSPQIEGFRSKGIEVLLLTDPVDDFWLSMVPEHDGKPFRSVTRGGSDLAAMDGEKAGDEEDKKGDDKADVSALVDAFKAVLGDAVKDVRTTDRLTDSAVCLVADEGDMDMHMERILKAHRKLDSASPRILEVNPAHPVIAALANATANGDNGNNDITEAAFLLLDQARLMEGDPLPDPVAFARRLATVLTRSLNG